MTIITRKRRDNFAIIPNAVANDDRLSFEARGLLVYLLAKPHDWQIRRSDLQRAGGIGRDKAQKLMRELIVAGYMERGEDLRDADGRIVGPQYSVSDFPILTALPLTAPEPENPVLVEPEPDLPAPVKPEPENPVPYKEQTLQKTESPLTPLTGGIDLLFEKLIGAWPMDHIGKRHVAEREFADLPPVKRQRAVDCAPAFLRYCVRRKHKNPRLSVYLSSQMFELVYGAPDLDHAGYYRIHIERPEWSAWLDHIRAKYGEARAAKCLDVKMILGKTRWPPGHSLANDVTKMATSKPEQGYIESTGMQ